MSLPNPNDVLEESWLLFFLTGLLGLRIVGRRYNRWMSYLYVCLLVILYCTSFLVIRESIFNRHQSLQDVIYYFKNQKLQFYVSLMIFPAIIFSSVIKSSDDLPAYKKLEEIDRVLFYLNNPIDHEIQMREDVVRIFIYLSVTIFLNLFTYLAIITVDCGHVFNFSWFLYSVPVFQEILTLYAFDILVKKIRVRFEHINRVIGNLLAPKKISVVLVHSTEINNASKLRLARRIHLRLHDAAFTMNKAYGLRLFLIFLVTLISVLNHFREALDLLENNSMILDLSLHFIWISFHVGKYFSLANSCRVAITEATFGGGFFFETSTTRRPDGLSEEIEAFHRQLLNNKLQFTACSVFSINFPKCLMIFIAILIYFLLTA